MLKDSYNIISQVRRNMTFAFSSSKLLQLYNQKLVECSLAEKFFNPMTDAKVQYHVPF